MNCQNAKCNKDIPYNSILNGTQVSCDSCSNAFYCSIKCRDFDWEGYHYLVCNGLFESVPKLSLSQLNYEMNLIGSGSFGQVYLKQLNGYNFAIKKINKYIGNRELKIHKLLKHKYIIQLLQFIEKEDDLYLVLEYAKYGHLTTSLQIDPKQVVLQLCNALQYLHQQGIIHRDIKPSNVLIDHRKNVKLCDFGLATHIDIISNFSGTYEFMAPEILRNYPQSYSVDIWSLGCLLYWMLEKKPIITGTEAEMIEQILIFTEPKFTIVDQCAKDLILKMLNPNPNERISLNQIFMHPFITREDQIKMKVEESSNSYSDETQTSYQTQQIVSQQKNNSTDRSVLQKIASLFTCMGRDK
ncbi:unnamed protein product [Paramecium sonneborni]|uniref:Protein kinase domain-containing protein n=1 Tax=Paramecium sonneborni TaxID=65129 RepID=A0A8S1LPN6_9CILI|nr:unnamed protein product [Paramecium sonneborni]